MCEETNKMAKFLIYISLFFVVFNPLNEGSNSGEDIREAHCRTSAFLIHISEGDNSYQRIFSILALHSQRSPAVTKTSAFSWFLSISTGHEICEYTFQLCLSTLFVRHRSQADFLQDSCMTSGGETAPARRHSF